MVSSPFWPIGWEAGSGGECHPSTLQFVVILWSNLYCVFFCERSKEGSVWIMKIMSVFYIYFVLYMCCNLLWINDKGKRRMYVTLCRLSAKQTIPLSVLAWNQTKGFGLEISAWPEVGRERRSESWTKELEEGSWRRVTRVTSRHRTAERQFGMREGPDQWLKSGQDRLAFQ